MAARNQAVVGSTRRSRFDLGLQVFDEKHLATGDLGGAVPVEDERGGHGEFAHRRSEAVVPCGGGAERSKTAPVLQLP